MCNLTSQLNFWSFLGDTKSINVYLGHYMSEKRNSTGCGTFPEDAADGIFMKYEILPPLGNGLTLVHEFGHWFGLQHTYTTFSNQNRWDDCDVSNAGDYVDDTPVQLAFDLDTYTNQTSLDSCPDQPGEDSFWNIMNKVCRGRGCFGDKAYVTEGQIQRMVSTHIIDIFDCLKWDPKMLPIIAHSASPSLKYLIWLLYRQHDEVCGDGQFLFGAEYPLQQWGDEVIIFDEDGKEVYNLRRTFFTAKRHSMNLCLHHNKSYFVAAFDGLLIYAPKVVLLIEGQVVKNIERHVESQAILFPVLPPDRNASAQENVSLTHEAPQSGCSNSTTDALLAFDELNGIQGASIYDMTGQGRRLERTFSRDNVYAQCVPRNGTYALLVCLFKSESSNYTVLVDGNPRATIDGPFHNPYIDIPHCRLTLLTPALLRNASDPVSIASMPPSQVPSLSPTTSAPTVPAASTNPSLAPIQTNFPSPATSPRPSGETEDDIFARPIEGKQYDGSASFTRVRFAVLPTLVALHHLYIQMV